MLQKNKVIQKLSISTILSPNTSIISNSSSVSTCREAIGQ